jgi:hypothetical protein
VFLQIKNISNTKGSILIIALIVMLAITFETFQQLYYIKRFQIADDVSFFSLLKTQSYRWIIWLLLSFVLIWYSRLKSSKKRTTLHILKLAMLIVGLVIFNIVVISYSQMFISGDLFSLKELISEYLPFFMYQKAPIYTLGYIAISMIMHLYFENEKLHIEVQELSELKLTNARLFKKLNSTIDEKATVLNIKIGNKRKIIPVEDICWIEADDYCVKVHTTSNGSYTMRSSLKALEEKLSTNFLRVHRKAIVNMSFARELHMSGSPNLILDNNTEIPVSKSHLKTVKDFLN